MAVIHLDTFVIREQVGTSTSHQRTADYRVQTQNVHTLYYSHLISLLKSGEQSQHYRRLQCVAFPAIGSKRSTVTSIIKTNLKGRCVFYSLLHRFKYSEKKRSKHTYKSQVTEIPGSSDPTLVFFLLSVRQICRGRLWATGAGPPVSIMRADKLFHCHYLITRSLVTGRNVARWLDRRSHLGSELWIYSRLRWFGRAAYCGVPPLGGPALRAPSLWPRRVSGQLRALLRTQGEEFVCSVIHKFSSLNMDSHNMEIGWFSFS